MSLEQILDLEQIEVWTYRGFSSRPGSTRVFGGQVAGQALVAAGRTVPAERQVHSLHAYFLRPGDTGAPLFWLPDDPLVHVCAVTYVSDLFLLSAALLPHAVAVGDPEFNVASLDHAVWFHAPFRADEWMRHEQVMQEGLIRSRIAAWPRGTR